LIVLHNQRQSMPQAPERRPTPVLPTPPPTTRPPPPTQPPPAAAAPRWLDEPPVVVSTDARSGTGTAFVVDSAGMWLTARHVAGHCRGVAIQGPRGWIEVQRVYSHAAADISVLATRGAPAGFALSRDEPRAGQIAFSFGFPRGEPGAVEHAYLGRSRMEMRGALSGIAPVTVWAERERWAATDEHLGGISGGPLVDARGQLLGIHVAGSPRRGRTIAVAPEMIAEAMARAPATRDREPAQLAELAITTARATAVLNRLRGDFHIVKVYCQA
jgi:S1-C subfamily serine protease